MRFVEIQDPVEFASFEVRIRCPKDENLYLVVTSRSIGKSPGSEDKARYYGDRDVENLQCVGFDASLWRVSKAVVNEKIK